VNPGQTPDTLNGTITGNAVDVTFAYSNGYGGHLTGTLASDCSMSGWWTSNIGQSGTWQATPESGQCGSPCALGAQSRNISGTPVPFEQVGDHAFSGTVAQFLGRGTGPAVDPRDYYATID
jgi:hypothetical protein